MKGALVSLVRGLSGGKSVKLSDLSNVSWTAVLHIAWVFDVVWVVSGSAVGDGE